MNKSQSESNVKYEDIMRNLNFSIRRCRELLENYKEKNTVLEIISDVEKYLEILSKVDNNISQDFQKALEDIRKYSDCFSLENINEIKKIIDTVLKKINNELSKENSNEER